MTSPHLTIALISDEKSSWQSLGLLSKNADHTVTEITAALENLGHRVVQIDGLKALISHPANCNHTEWDLALNTAEGMEGLPREAQVPCLLEAYEISFTFADAATTSLCQDKGRTKMVLQYLGIRTAPSVIIPASRAENPASPTQDLIVQGAIEKSRRTTGLQQYPLFAKPVGESISKGILSCCKTTKPEALATTVVKLSALYGNHDILLEPFVSGLEITVGILGKGEDAKVLGANEYIYKRSPRPSSGDVEEEEEELVDFASDSIKNALMDTNPHMAVVPVNRTADLQVHDAYELALATWKALGCRDAGRVDARFDRMGDAGLPYVLEVNPIPGMIPDWSDFALIATSNGASCYEGFLNGVLSSALKRVWSRVPRRKMMRMRAIVIGSDEVSEPVVTRRVRWEKYNLRT